MKVQIKWFKLKKQNFLKKKEKKNLRFLISLRFITNDELYNVLIYKDFSVASLLRNDDIAVAQVGVKTAAKPPSSLPPFYHYKSHSHSERREESAIHYTLSDFLIYTTNNESIPLSCGEGGGEVNRNFSWKLLKMLSSFLVISKIIFVYSWLNIFAV